MGAYWTKNYTNDEIEVIMDCMLYTINDIVDEKYNCGSIDNKEEIIQYFTGMGFHRKTVLEWYDWLDED